MAILVDTPALSKPQQTFLCPVQKPKGVTILFLMFSARGCIGDMSPFYLSGMIPALRILRLSYNNDRNTFRKLSFARCCHTTTPRRTCDERFLGRGLTLYPQRFRMNIPLVDITFPPCPRSRFRSSPRSSRVLPLDGRCMSIIRYCLMPTTIQRIVSVVGAFMHSVTAFSACVVDVLCYTRDGFVNIRV